MNIKPSDELTAYLVNHNSDVFSAFQKMMDEEIIERIWKKDHTVWSNIPDEITNRLDWLDSPEEMITAVDEIEKFVQEIRNKGFKKALLLGMGGSSLAPEVFRLTFGVREGYIDVSVLDSTHPEAVKAAADSHDPKDTLYIVSTKSGGTVETISFMKFFYNYAWSKIGEHTPKHFVAITDPGSGLQKIATELKFRKIFLNNPNIGGRFSALSYFGLVPAALLGININNLLERAQKEANDCKESNAEDMGRNNAALLGLVMGTLANKGINKLTFITSPQIRYFGAWAEQLIAESTGKIGRGIVPVDLEEVLDVENYREDRLFVHLKLKNDFTYNEKFTQLREAKHPALQIVLEDVYDLGREFFRWEFATCIAGWITGIQPFDQPDVESAKVIAREKLKKYDKEGALPAFNYEYEADDIQFSDSYNGNDTTQIITNFLNKYNKPGCYVNIQAYVKPDSTSAEFLQYFRSWIQKKYKIATTLGFGPRFLHSTGQLHKGDSGEGIFIQITENKKINLPIPDEAGKPDSSVTFDVLIDSQAMGDLEALKNKKRNVLRLNIKSNSRKVLSNFIEMA